ncbi:MAG: hypothetical protein IKA17_04665 [Clostridia bacterium]|nr:hypothetical protein [Clostridia bacterium]
MFKKFLNYYKWQIIFFILIFICGMFVLSKTTVTFPADLRIAYTSTHYLNSQTFNDNKSEIEMLLNEATNDDKKVATIKTFSSDNIDEVKNKLRQYVKSDVYDIYIASKQAFDAIEDKSVFIDVSRYESQIIKRDTMLEDSSGRAYAVPLEGNTIIELLGGTDTKGLYIAAAAEKGEEDEISAFRKNGINICGYIIENKDKYNY